MLNRTLLDNQSETLSTVVSEDMGGVEFHVESAGEFSGGVGKETEGGSGGGGGVDEGVLPGL
jgi:hypothetical protein